MKTTLLKRLRKKIRNQVRIKFNPVLHKSNYGSLSIYVKRRNGIVFLDTFSCNVKEIDFYIEKYTKIFIYEEIRLLKTKNINKQIKTKYKI